MTPLCFICNKRPQRSEADSFCKPCGDEFANDMAEIWDFTGPAVRSIMAPTEAAHIELRANVEACSEVARAANLPARYFDAHDYEPERMEQDYGSGCTVGCGYCGACT